MNTREAPVAEPRALRDERPVLDFLRRFVRHRTAAVGGVMIILFTLVAIFAPYIAPHDPFALNFRHRLEGPSSQFWLGTDELGRDILSRIIYGSRISMTVGVVSVAIGLVIGGLLGALAGFFRPLDNVIMRLVDIMLAFPSILLAIAVVSILGPGLTNLMIAVGIRSVPSFARMVRGMVLQVSQLEYTVAARALGATEARILFRTVLPNCLAPVLVFSTLEMAKAILLGSILSFVGLGPEPPTPEWGKMVADARAVLRNAPHVALFPGLAILLTVLGFNLLGDGLRDTLDPRLRQY
ncbi:MAG TPA: ABC transporter permease [Limnochordales bacterium]